MTGFSSVKIGDAFEEEVFNVLSVLLERDELFHPSKRSKIFRKKGYFSSARNKEIITDISIETYLDGAEDYSFLTIFECKSLTGSVPVDDVEEFDSKLNQIGKHNTKGVIISRSSFQEGAVTTAKSFRIGLARLPHVGKLNWISYRKDITVCEYPNGILSNDLIKEETENSFFGYATNKSFFNLFDLLIGLRVIDRYVPEKNLIRIPYRSLEIIQKIIEDEFDSNVLYSPSGKSNLDLVCSVLKQKFGVVFNFDNLLGHEHGNQVLGKLRFDPLEIYVSADLKSDVNRWRFTLAHEIGHLVLHLNDLKRYFYENTDTDNSTSFAKSFLPSVNRPMEVQANIFASLLLVNRKILVTDFDAFRKRESINKPYLYLDYQPCNQQLVFELLHHLSYKYSVSKQAIEYVLTSLHLIQREPRDLSKLNMTSMVEAIEDSMQMAEG